MFSSALTTLNVRVRSGVASASVWTSGRSASGSPPATPAGCSRRRSRPCAGTPGTDSCFGDSGGALAISYDDPIQHITYPVLAGIVSYGDLACDGEPPGVYTRIASPAIRSYLTQGSPVSAPRNGSPPTVGGTVAVGQTVT